jgi:hypothetical protein
MRIYIAGPMSGIPGYNFAAFDAARDRINAAGHVAVSPADMDRERWPGWDPASGPPPDLDREVIIKQDLNAIDQCGAIYMLQGWERSLGAQVEYAYGIYKGLGFFFETDEVL